MICLFSALLTLLGVEQSIHWKLLFGSREFGLSFESCSSRDSIVGGGLNETASMTLTLTNGIAVE